MKILKTNNDVTLSLTNEELELLEDLTGGVWFIGQEMQVVIEDSKIDTLYNFAGQLHIALVEERTKAPYKSKAEIIYADEKSKILN